MKSKKIAIVDAPPEVQRVWAIQMCWEMMGIGVGSILYNQSIAIIKKYPEWFPEENKALNNIKKEQNEKNSRQTGSSVVGKA